ncbi:hypothetical protein AQ616_12035 [Oceanobacillus sp. E9]|uniref:hypothetical protein n=1 Tax=Oceanobacillus TaxID=182709 RepID=UPI00084ECD41|nr:MULTISPECIES: hypothetical protein [Oceanobacillus]OEH54480.1 hypothetical protein AQ616_12035 [Oceanobacillus sp. E9]
MRNKKLLFVNLGILFVFMVVVIIGISRVNATTEEEQPSISKSKRENQSTQISGLSQLSKKVVFSGKEIYKPRNLLERGDNGSFVLNSGNVKEASTEGDEVEVPTGNTHNSNLNQSNKQVTIETHSASSSNESNRSGSSNVKETTSSSPNAEKKDDTKPKNNDSNTGTDKNKGKGEEKGENKDKTDQKEKPEGEKDGENGTSEPNPDIPPKEEAPDGDNEEEKDPDQVEDPEQENEPGDGGQDPNPRPQTSK